MADAGDPKPEIAETAVVDDVTPTTIAEVSALDPVARVCPHARLHRLREAAPVLWDEAGRTFFLTRHADVRAALFDETLSHDPAEADPLSYCAMFKAPEDAGEQVRRQAQTLTALDDPDHGRIRRVFSEAFYPRATRMQGEVERIVVDAIDAAPASGPFDLVEAVTVRIPVQAIAKIIGVPDDVLPNFRAWSESISLLFHPFRTPEQSAEMSAGFESFDALFRELMEKRRAEPGDDLVTDLVALQAAGAPVSDDDLSSNLQLMVAAGNLTSTDMMTNGAWLLLTHPEELAKLKADPDLAKAAVEEILRMESPLAASNRIVMDEREIGGVPMKPTQPIFISLLAAHRDPAVYADPDRFDIARKGPANLAFGGGAHLCLGAALARHEGRVFFRRLFERFPDLRLADPDAPVEWRGSPFFRGIEKLMVEA